MQAPKTMPARVVLLQFIWNEPLHRKYLFVALFLTIASWITFKYYYPDPDFISDSYSYIFGAAQHLDLNIWPIGYSKFLLFLHGLTHSALATVSIQYFLLQIASLYFFFTFLALVNPSRTTVIVIFIFLFFNPLFLYVSNLINSDALFATLSLLWISELIWVMKRPHLIHLVISAVLVFLCFTVRNNAYYYPLVSVVAFLSSKSRRPFKLAGIILPLALIVPFIIRTREIAFRMTESRQFSLFSGWQLANNALYGYQYTNTDSSNFPPSTRALNRATIQFFRQPPANFRKLLANLPGNYFIISPLSPLKTYFESHYDLSTDYKIAQSWGKASAVYAEYGKALIKQNPFAYARGFLLLNLKNYLYPPLQNFTVYNTDKSFIASIEQDWFDWRAPDLRVASKTAGRTILFPYPILFLFLHIYTISLIVQCSLQRSVSSPQLSKSLMALSVTFLLLNFAFTLLATMNILRYQVVPMTILLTTALTLSDALQRKWSTVPVLETDPNNQLILASPSI